MTYTPISTELVDSHFRAALSTHSGRGDPFAGSYSRRLSKAPDGPHFRWMIPAALVLMVVAGLAVRL